MRKSICHSAIVASAIGLTQPLKRRSAMRQKAEIASPHRAPTAC